MTENQYYGHSLVPVQPLGVGTNKVGGHNLFPDLKDEDGAEVIQEAIASDVGMIDTAFMYGNGRSEEIIGENVPKKKRNKVIIATKGAQHPDDTAVIDNSPAFLKQAVADSLKRLQTKYVDIFYIHFPDQNTPKNEATATLDELRQEGKVRAIGVSNFSLQQIREANLNGMVDVVEDNYSLLHRDAERTLFPYLREQGISFVPYFPLASGLLTGKYSRDDGAKFKQFTAEQFGKAMDGIDVVRKIANTHDATVAQTVLAWYIANPDIATVIPGARNAKQLAQNVKARDVELTDAEYKQIDDAFSEF